MDISVVINRFRRFTIAAMLAATLLSSAALAQGDTTAQTPPPASAGPYHISEAEAKELFRSVDLLSLIHI